MDSTNLDYLSTLSQGRSDLPYQPEILPVDDPATPSRIRSLQQEGLVERYIDALPEAIEDLFKIEFPFIPTNDPTFATTFDQFQNEQWNQELSAQKSVLIYLPWKKTLVRIPRSDIYTRLRTARNRFLITEDEQLKYYAGTVGIAGMSIGSQVLTALTLTGGPSHLRLADFDVLSITNMNRLPGTIADLSQSKLLAAVRRTYEVNPFADLTLFPDGLQDDNLDQFFNQPSKLDVFIEECDNIRMKIISRFKARELGIPVIMSTDNGDNAIIDVERFDLEPNRPLFHGRVDEERLAKTSSSLPLAEKTRLANDIVGPDVVPRMQQSLQAVGSDLPAWPQLGTAAMISGVALSYITRRILTGQSMPSGRYEVHIDGSLDPQWNTPEAVAQRAQEKEEFIEGFNLVFSEEINV
jgi:hypothetical protein